MNFDYGMMWYDAALDAAKLGVQTYDHFKKKAVQAELATAKTTALDAAAKFDELITESILNGGTKATQNADGMWDITPDQSLMQWRTEQMEAIAASSDSKEVSSGGCRPSARRMHPAKRKSSAEYSTRRRQP